MRAGDGPPGRPWSSEILSPSAPFSEQIADNRLLIAGLLVLFVLLALVSAAFVSRALTGQIATFLAAARRLSRGDFRQPVPVEGNDEFAAARARVQRHVRAARGEDRGGRAQAPGARPRRSAGWATRSPPASTATASWRWPCARRWTRARPRSGRALPLARGAFARCEVGAVDGELERAIEAAERDVFAVRPDVGPELLGALEGDESAERTRRAVSAHAGGCRTRCRSGCGRSSTGRSTSARSRSPATATPFTREEEELLEYLAGQAVVSIENASLHETVERQAVTDELTGLANVRALPSTLDRELERSRRFGTPLGLVMVDLDDFKRVNDTYGHQQGDEVLAQVAGVLRDLSASSTRRPATAARSWRWSCRRRTPPAPSCWPSG